MKKIIAIIGILIFAVSGVLAQDKNAYKGEVYYDSKIQKRGDKVTVELTIDVEDFKIRRQQMVEFKPTIKSRSDADTKIEMPSIIVARAKRYRALKREMAYGEVKFDQEPIIIKYSKSSNKQIVVTHEIKFAEWLRDADLEVHECTSGCATCNKVESDTPISEVVPPVYSPKIQAVIIEPPVEEIKERSETFVARINYEVDKHKILTNYKNNGKEFKRIDGIMKELINDPDLTITKLGVVGYASPEGNFNKNRTLSENRAKAFLEYLQKNYGLSSKSIAYKGMGEDWDGLYEAIESIDMEAKDNVLDIIKNTEDIALRKKQLQGIEKGRVYKFMLTNLYPPLRRNEFEVAYVVRKFDIEEARKLIKTRPQLLSLNEMYILAQSYEKYSEEYNYIFDVAARMFPEDTYAKLNASALEIEAGAYDWAIQRLAGIESAEAYNNLGIAYFQKGNYDLAIENLRKSADMGYEVAKLNLEEIRRWQNSMDSTVIATTRPQSENNESK